MACSRKELDVRGGYRKELDASEGKCIKVVEETKSKSNGPSVNITIIKWKTLNTNFVQILNVCGNDWVCASNIGCPPNILATFFSDSGLSHSICYCFVCGKDPSQYLFDQGAMREHLKYCLEKGVMSDFTAQLRLCHRTTAIVCKMCKFTVTVDVHGQNILKIG